MKRIKSILIHLLGGITVDEAQESDFNSFTIGRYVAISHMQDTADKLYGVGADEWCSKVYQEILNMHNDITRDFPTNTPDNDEEEA